MNSQSRLRWNFSGSVNFQVVFSSDSVNVAGPLSKTTTKSLSQPILFSFTDNDKGYATNQEQVAKDLYEALRQFFIVFEDVHENDFFVTGESYAGKYQLLT